MKIVRTTAILALLTSFSIGASRCTPAGGEIQLGHAIEFDGLDNARVMKLVPRRERVKLEDANGELLARFTLDAGRLRVERAPRELMGFVVPAEEGGRGLQILDARGENLIYQLVREPDGDLRLEDHGHNVLYVVKLREYGFKTVDAGGAVQSRVRVKPEKVSLRDASGRTTLSTRDAIPPAAAACFTLGDLSLEFQTGLALGVIHWGLENP
ncbi:MAG: hypothetical protein E2O71_10010 [Deltaproteobacteria bacterium]|nr:MAG: hypothetical protein E2O71_10010 [Deltaproteobacteria bacterium]